MHTDREIRRKWTTRAAVEDRITLLVDPDNKTVARFNNFAIARQCAAAMNLTTMQQRVNYNADKIPGETTMKCTHKVIDPQHAQWRKSNGEGLACKRPAQYEIRGRCYCKRHAQIVVLELLVNGAAAPVLTVKVLLE